MSTYAPPFTLAHALFWRDSIQVAIRQCARSGLIQLPPPPAPKVARGYRKGRCATPDMLRTAWHRVKVQGHTPSHVAQDLGFASLNAMRHHLCGGPNGGPSLAMRAAVGMKEGQP